MLAPTALPTAPTSASSPVLQALGAVVDYGERTILQGLDLAVHAGEIYALLGANGAGKTTTLSLFLGFVRPRSGQVRVQGVDPVVVLRVQPGGHHLPLEFAVAVDADVAPWLVGRVVVR